MTDDYGNADEGLHILNSDMKTLFHRFMSNYFTSCSDVSAHSSAVTILCFALCPLHKIFNLETIISQLCA